MNETKEHHMSTTNTTPAIPEFKDGTATVAEFEAYQKSIAKIFSDYARNSGLTAQVTEVMTEVGLPVPPPRWMVRVTTDHYYYVDGDASKTRYDMEGLLTTQINDNIGDFPIPHLEGWEPLPDERYARLMSVSRA